MSRVKKVLAFSLLLFGLAVVPLGASSTFCWSTSVNGCLYDSGCIYYNDRGDQIAKVHVIYDPCP